MLFSRLLQEMKDLGNVPAKPHEDDGRLPLHVHNQHLAGIVFCQHLGCLSDQFVHVPISSHMDDCLPVTLVPDFLLLIKLGSEVHLSLWNVSLSF